MSERIYIVNEIFYSIQGEGVRAGTANIFVRFSGCNQTCRKETHGFDCDTEFVSGRRMTAQDIINEADKLAPSAKSIILTGGEPMLQVDDDLTAALKAAGYYLAIETNGSLEVAEHIDWITVSPKVAEHAIRQMTASEVKYVRGYGQGIPKPACKAEHYLISPAFNGLQIDRRALEWCINLVRENPDWRLSVQAHKHWSVR